MKNTCPTEYQEQCAFVEYLEAKKLKFTAIPNSTFVPKRDNASFWGQLNRNKKSGVRKGLPDLLIILPNLSLLFVEMKRLKGSTTSPEQKEWIDALNNIDNVEAVICKGAAAAIEYVENIIN